MRAALFTKYYYDGRFEDNEMDRACTMHRIDEKCIQNFLSGNMRKRHSLEDLGVDGRIILKWILKAIEWEHVGWIRVAPDRDQW
jgi:hypothetical protein